MKGRRLVGFALFGACLPLLVAWLSTTNPNCAAGGGTYAGCYAWGYPRVKLWTALAVPGALLATGVGALLPARWREGLVAAGGPLFAPDGRTLAALPVVVVVAALLAPPLFFGTLTARPWLWLLLAAPYAPFLVAATGLFAAVNGAPGTLVTVVLLPVTLATTVAQAAWFLWLASLPGRCYDAASKRNSASE